MPPATFDVDDVIETVADDFRHCHEEIEEESKKHFLSIAEANKIQRHMSLAVSDAVIFDLLNESKIQQNNPERADMPLEALLGEIHRDLQSAVTASIYIDRLKPREFPQEVRSVFALVEHWRKKIFVDVGDFLMRHGVEWEEGAYLNRPSKKGSIAIVQAQFLSLEQAILASSEE